VKAIISRLIVAVAAVAAVTCFDVPAGRAATFGNAPWCAVINQGAGSIMWECEYASVADCAPYVVAGNRGFCARNPYWQRPVSAPVVRHWHHKHYVRD